ncbi:MAG: hypothetical protein E7609_05720 [Ruminococcaceae bacterium]|nr:hypothetical protein [Oscillospiraceae bacterium]
MSKFKYVLGLVAAIAAFIFFFTVDFAEGFEEIVFGYMLAASVAELIWWDSIAVKIPFFLLKFTLTVFLFWWGILFSGIILFIVALVIATPVFGFIASLLAGSITLLLLLSSVFFPFHAFSHARNLD